MRCQYFNEVKFTQSHDNDYYSNSTIHKRMHVYVWEFYNGPVPKGYEVHHKDLDKSNNDISNLQLLTRSEHKKLHADLLTDEQRQWRRDNLAKTARPKASEWHKSEEGLAWHKKQAETRKDNRTEQLCICDQCGKEFTVLASNHVSRFCSGACKAKYRRYNKLDNIERTCVICGNVFSTNKFKHIQTCSKSCGRKLSALNKKEHMQNESKSSS